MVKKKADVNKDLTRIEDLSEFVHVDDSELDSRFDGFSPSNDLSSTGIKPDALDSEALPDIPLDNPSEEDSYEPTSDDEVSFESSEETPVSDFSFEENSFGDTSFEENSTNGSIDSDELESSSINPMEGSSDAFGLDFGLDSTKTKETEDFEEESEEETTEDPIDSSPHEIYTHTSEKFEDVKTFAQNFSYGQVQGGGNPPYTIIVRHIKFKEEAADILNLLRELGVVNDQNANETEKALEFGSLIIPQISEYTAIVLAHKLRRFDLDLEVGLSDEVHPSKSGESNPRGLIKKDNLRQNKTESLRISDINNPITEIIISTTSSIPGFVIESYIGVQTTFAIVEEAELERLQYVQKSQRAHSELYDFENTETNELTSEKAFRDYQNSFSLLYEDLTTQLKQKAFTQNANALLGISFQLSPLNFERSQARVSAYQITCSATLAIVSRENN